MNCLDMNASVVSCSCFFHFNAINNYRLTGLGVIGESQGNFTKGDEMIECGLDTELPICTKRFSETNLPDCDSNASWVSSSTSEEDDGLEAPFHLLFSPEYYKPAPIRTLVQSEDINKSLLEGPLKQIPVGPDFQADVPEWDAHASKNISDDSGGSIPLTPFPQPSELDLSGRNDDGNKLAGICVIPMPEFGSSMPNSDKVGDGRTNCCCEDSGSTRCVRQHIKEAREKVWRILGPERFFYLGFSDMGEVVADKWSLEEERVFHEVVFSNPASLGKNFWDHLSVAFPSRTKSDIVSYYFNVFMLIKRAEQNRFDPANIDSDDDEWQDCDDYGDDGVETVEEDEDSVESPVCHDDPGHNEILEDDPHEDDDSVVHAGFNNCESIDAECDDGIANVPETCCRKLLNNCSSDPALPQGRLIRDERGDLDYHDESCTSSDAGTATQLTQVGFNSTSGGGSQEFVMEPCETEAWDVGYLTCTKNQVDFLPTCSMIEEVFGSGAWNYEARDDDKGF